MKKLLLALTVVLACSACGTSSVEVSGSPEETVVGFLRASLTETTSINTYVEQVDPYLNDAALSSVREKLETGESSYFKCSSIEIKKVKELSPTEAEVEVSYVMTVLGETGSNEYDKTVTFALANTSGKWEIVE